jgi:hypothetical protein
MAGDTEESFGAAVVIILKKATEDFHSGSLPSGEFLNTVFLYKDIGGRQRAVRYKGIYLPGSFHNAADPPAFRPVRTQGTGFESLPPDTAGNESAGGMFLLEIRAGAAGAFRRTCGMVPRTEAAIETAGADNRVFLKKSSSQYQ